MKQTQLLLEYLHRAVAAKHGIVVSAYPIKTAIAALYKARQESGDPILKQLQFRRSPLNPDTELWIVRDEEKANAAEEASRLFVSG